MTSQKGAIKRAALPRQIAYSRKFLKDYQSINKAGRSDVGRLREFILLMAANAGPLAPEWLDHALSGELAGFRDVHLHGDFLVLYRITGDPETVVFERLGTHSDLF